ncbi:glycosyltransferase family 2 protein [Gordonia sp. DT30]|uniref:glycosyltransferase family 2 protein n=1 Tax=unclassified Gordonia (in: high G+C Gram-positive bacteria) TaxID=2657482 RepID=UPI003CEF7CC1
MDSDKALGPEDRRGGDGPAITVVIITHNRCAELDRTLAELDRGGMPPTIVVDNAGTDATADVVGRHAAAHPMVRYVRLPQNIGALGRNHGVTLADTPYVAFCDDDSWWAPGSLDAAVEVLDAHPEVGALTGRTLVNAENRPDPINAELAASTLPGPASLPGPRVLGFLACATVVRVDAFRSVGGFSPVLGFVGEEALLAMDLAADGWYACYVEELVVHHHPSPMRSPSDRRGRELTNSVLTDAMRRPLPRAARSGATLLGALLRREVPPGHLGRALSALPGALRHRVRLPPEVERDLVALEAGR